MQLTFEHQQNIGAGTQPAAIHSADNHVQIFFVRDSKIHVMDAETPFGAWDARDFNAAYVACRDTDPLFLKLKYLSGTNIWVVWRNMAEDSDEGYQPDYVRHRIAVFTLLQNVSKYLATGSLEFSQNNPVAQLVLELKNPNQEVSSEDDSVIAPGANIAIYFRAGSSARYPLGRYYVDRNKMTVTGGMTNVEGRNAIGKLLRDQSFDEDSEVAFANLKTALEGVLDDAGVPEESRVIYPSVNDVGMRFPPDMKVLDGILEILKTAIWWTIKERMDGKIVLGPHWWEEFDQPGVYDFNRGTDVWSREVTREDEEAYSRVCVYHPEYTVRDRVDLDGKIYSASASYGDNTEDKAFDKLVATFWETRSAVPQYIQVDLGEGNEEIVNKVRWYVGNKTYAPKGYEIQGSNDGDDWTKLEDGSSSSTVGWKERTFDNENAYRYYRFRITTAFSSARIYLYEIQLYAAERTIPEVRAYADVETRFPLPRKKTQYVQVAQGTTQERCEEYAGELAEMQANVGVVETFVGPIRPHLQPGDEARIHDVGSKLLGVITTVRHLFGENGFATEMVVDSGGVIAKNTMREYIEKISGRQVSPSSVKRLYS